MDVILKTNKLTKTYKKENAVDNVSITIERGEIYGFVGKNGAGKTTLIRVICGLANKSSGSYELFGIKDNDKRINKAREKMSGIVEVPALYLNMTAYENLQMQAWICKVKNANEKILELLKLVELDDVPEKKKAKDYSLGMKQRLAVAVALLNDPEFLVMDEPMNGLDPEGIKQLRELLVTLNQRGITILMSSHILGELAKIANKYIFIHKGKLIEEITAQALNDKLENYLEIELNLIENHISILSETLKNIKYDINGNKLKIYGNVEPSTVIMSLTNAGITIKNMHTHDIDVENYFIKLIGGEK